MYITWIVANRPNQMARRRQAVAHLRDSRGFLRLWGPRPQQSQKHPRGRVEQGRRQDVKPSRTSSKIDRETQGSRRVRWGPGGAKGCDGEGPQCAGSEAGRRVQIGLGWWWWGGRRQRCGGIVVRNGEGAKGTPVVRVGGGELTCSRMSMAGEEKRNKRPRTVALLPSHYTLRL